MIDSNYHPDRQHERNGSASWASSDAMRRAGFHGRNGLFVGYDGNRPLRLASDAPGLIIAGSGSGKGRDWLIEAILRNGRSPLLVFDPKGELAAVTLPSFAHAQVHVYLWNPSGLHGLPRHRLNPLDVLSLASADFHSGCTSIVNALIPMPTGGSGNAVYFVQRAREWIEGLIKALVEQNSTVTLPMLWRTIQSIQSSPERWAAMLDRMDQSGIEQVRDTATDIWSYQSRPNSNEFAGILGTIKANLNFVNDLTLSASLENPDFSLKDLTGEQITSLFVMVPRDFIAQWSSALRTIFVVASKYKARAPQARRITALIDEAGRMGNFEALIEAFAIGRGEGTRTIALFQDIGQIARNYGHNAISGFVGSSQWRAFFGVRDHDTALLVSQMLGNESLAFDDALQQADARRQQQLATQRLLQGGDPLQAAGDFRHFGDAARQQKTMPRALLSSDEILRLPEDRMISFISGLNLPPILAHKYPYYTTRSLNGWLANPYHPPLDRVRLRGIFWDRTAEVITAPVPEALAHYPQYSDGIIRYVTGYAP